ncbi:MAG: PD40 domain-containing protein [Planctomycetes bacterium]|nr:PD40 domain-containing protein [Planctomycetota bacterium]
MLPTMLLATALATFAVLPQDPLPLLPKLRDRDAKVQAAAARDLEAIGPKAIPPLRELLAETKDQDLRTLVEHVLGGIELEHPGGLLVAFTRGEAKASELWVWRDGVETVLTADHAMDYALSLSPDGARLAFVRTPDHHDYGMHPTIVRELATGDERELARAHAPAWSPDGAWLALATDGGIVLVPFGADAKERQQRTLGRDLGKIHHAAWSPNGRFLACEAGDAVVVLDAAAGTVHARLDGTPAGTSSLYSFSLGDSLVSMVSGNGPYHWWVYLAPIAGGEPRRLHEQPFRHGITALSPREDLVFCTQSKGEDYASFVLDTADGASREVFANASPLLRPTWSADGRFVVFVDGKDTIQLLHARSGRTRAIATMQEGYGPNGMAFAPAVWFGAGRPVPLVRGVTATPAAK